VRVLLLVGFRAVVVMTPPAGHSPPDPYNCLVGIILFGWVFSVHCGMWDVVSCVFLVGEIHSVVLVFLVSGYVWILSSGIGVGKRR